MDAIDASSSPRGDMAPIGGPLADDVPRAEMAVEGPPLGGLDLGTVAVDAAGTGILQRSPSRSRLVSWLVVWDALVPTALLLIAARFTGHLGPAINGASSDRPGPLAALLAVLCPLGLAMAGSYHQRRRRGGSRLMYAMRLVIVAMAVCWVALVVSAAAGWPVDLGQMLGVSLMLPPAWLLGRWACDRHPATRPERVLLVGSGMVAERVLELTERHRERRLEIVGRVESAPLEADHAGPPLLGDLAGLPGVIRAHHIERVIVAFGPDRDSEMLDVLRDCTGAGVQIDVVPRLFDLVGPAPRAHSIGSLALLEVPGRGLTRAQRIAKRGLDIAGSLALLAVFAPVIAGIALAIAVTDGRPVLFRQTRVGQRGRSFSILKYRTMAVDSDAAGLAGYVAAADRAAGLDNAEQIADVVRELKGATETRVTRLGTFLRTTSLDELPQLLNVLRGDMSLVGPRPLRPFEAAALSPWQLARQELRPGLTGLWQVLGRSNVEWDERMQLDYSYVSHWSFASDLQILARTLPAVLKRDGAV